MLVSNPRVKELIFAAVNFTNEVDEKGQKIKRVTWKKDHYLPVTSLSRKLADNQEVVFGTPEVRAEIEEKGSISLTEEKVAELGGWKPWVDLTDENRATAIAVRYSSNEIEFTDKEKAAIKHFWKELEEVPEVSAEAFEELETLLA